jgi:hypothetical protein
MAGSACTLQQSKSKTIGPLICPYSKVTDQLGGLEAPEKFERKVGEEQGKYIFDGEKPF